MARLDREVRKIRRKVGTSPMASLAIGKALAERLDNSAVPLLLDVIRQAYDDRTCRDAADAIVGMGFAAIDPLIGLLGRDEGLDEVSKDLLVELAPDSTGALISALRDRRKAAPAARALSDIGDADAIPALERVAQGRFPTEARAMALFALGAIGDARAFDSLLAATRDRRAQIRSRAVYALGRLNYTPADEHIASALNDRHADVRQAAVYALGRGTRGDAVGLLAHALEDREREVQSSAVFALEELGDERAVPALMRILVGESGNPISNAYSAARVIGRLGEPGKQALLEAMRHPDPRVRSNAAQGFKKKDYPQEIEDPDVIRALVASVTDEEADYGGFSLLVDAPSRLAADLLLPLLDDARPEVRSRAVHAIWIHGDDDVYEKLNEMAKDDPDPGVRAQAQHGVGVSGARRRARAE